MSFNSSNVNVMKEAVNALPIMKEAIEKVPLMEQVAYESTGSGIVTNAMPPPGANTSSIMNGYTPVKATMRPVKKLPRAVKATKPPGYPGTFKIAKPASVKPANPIRPSLNTDETIHNITGVQSQLSNSLLNQVNNILTHIGEQTINTVMPNMSGGLSMKKPMRQKTMGLVAPGTKCPPCLRGTKRVAGTCQCATILPVEKSPQEKLNNLTNTMNENIASISKGLDIISKYLPCPDCPSCPPCESSNPEESSNGEEPSEEVENMQGGRRSGTRRSRVKKSKKTLRNRRS
jgi:hypothetical protein